MYAGHLAAETSRLTCKHCTHIPFSCNMGVTQTSALLPLSNCMMPKGSCAHAGLIAAGTVQPVSSELVEQGVLSQVECESSNVENTEPGRF